MTAIPIPKRSIPRNRTLPQFLLILAYLLFQLLLLQHHEVWRDESQAWILARNSTVPELFGLCASEGHPILWFLILKFCIFLGMPFSCFGLLSVGIMGIAAVLLVRHSPFTMLTNVCILLSPVFCYYNPVICRIYSVVMLLVCILCILWPSREERPVRYGLGVALLFQTHILMAGLAAGCLLERIISCRKSFSGKKLAGILLPALSMAGLYLELRQTRNTETFLRITPEFLLAKLNVPHLKTAALSVANQFSYAGFPAGILAPVLLLLLIFLLAAFCAAAVKDAAFRKAALPALLVTLCGMGVYWGIILLVRPAEHIQMAVVSLFFPLFLTWTAVQHRETPGDGEGGNPAGTERKPSGRRFLSGRLPEAVFCICCLVLLPKSAVLDPRADLTGPFSGSREMAKTIEAVAEAHAVIALPNDLLAPSIAAYLYDSPKDYLLWDLDNACAFGIHKWGRENARNTGDKTVEELLAEDGKDTGPVYYVQTSETPELPDLSSDRMELLGGNEGKNTWNEYYQLYRVVKEYEE